MDRRHVKVNAAKLMQILTTDRTLLNAVVLCQATHSGYVHMPAQTQIKTLIQHDIYTNYYILKINRT